MVSANVGRYRLTMRFDWWTTSRTAVARARLRPGFGGKFLRELKGQSMQKITPFLWFDTQAEEAMNFYLSVFKDSKVLSCSRYGDAGPGPKGAVMVAKFQLDGQDFMAL